MVRHGRLGLAEVIESACVHWLVVVGPADDARLSIDLANALAFGDASLPDIGPGLGKAQHQLKVLSSGEAPIRPSSSLRPAFGRWKLVVLQHRSAAAAAAETCDGREQSVAAVGSPSPPGQMLRFAGQQLPDFLQPWGRSLVACDRLVPQG